MRHIAVVAAAAVMFAMVAPAFAQPFADVPTNHWAYDAIAELAAKGLVEGYPDGTFKGDRAMTRYEMAMVVARLLARIESIQIPPAAPAPQVTKADLDALQRLINEFRAELAALGVRVTAIEEELNAIKAKLDNVRITGRWRGRYDGSTSPSGPSVNGNSNTGSIGAGSTPNFRARMGGKLMFDGSVSPDIHAILGLELGTGLTSTPATFNGAAYAQGSGTGAGCNGGTPCYQFANIAEFYLDWNHAWGLPLRIQVGRMGGIVNGFGMLPLQFGPHGLLVNTTSDTYGASNGNTGTALWDGIRLSGGVEQWADLKYQVAAWRVVGANGGGSYFLGEDAYGFDANFRVMQGLRVGGYYVWNQINAASPAFPSNATSALWHVYGNPNTPLTNPPTALVPSSGAGCPAVGAGTLLSVSGGGTSQGGIECHAQGSGYGGYVTWQALPGITFDGEIAWWNDGTANISDNAYYVDAVIDLGALTGIGHKLALTLSWENAGQNFIAPYQSDIDYDIAGSVGPGNAQALTADISFDFTDQLGFLGAYITGSNLSNGMGFNEWRAGVVYRFAPGANIYARWEQQSINGVSQYTLYRAEVNYNF